MHCPIDGCWETLWHYAAHDHVLFDHLLDFDQLTDSVCAAIAISDQELLYLVKTYGTSAGKGKKRSGGRKVRCAFSIAEAGTLTWKRSEESSQKPKARIG
jgi:hypothetical protein